MLQIIYCIFISLCSAAFFAETTFQLHLTPQWNDLIFIAASTFTTYMFNSVFVKLKQYNNLGSLIKKHIPECTLILINFSISFYYVRSYQSDIIIYLIHLVVLAVAYSIPIFGNKALRAIPLLKTFLIVYVWVIVGTVLPSKIYHTVSLNFEYIIAEHIIFILMLAIAFDIRDYQLDFDDKIGTLPTLIGVSYSSYLAFLLGPIAMILALNISFEYGILLAIADFSMLMVLFRAPSLKDAKLFAYGADGIIILRLALIWWGLTQ